MVESVNKARDICHATVCRLLIAISNYCKTIIRIASVINAIKYTCLTEWHML